MEFTEHRGEGTPSNHYVFSTSSRRFVTAVSNRSGHSALLMRVKCWIREAFLPQGFPHSVSNDYLQYQLWDSLQAYCSSIVGALSLRATLEGLGVGKSNANPLAATLIWLLNDGSGMISSILFAYWKGTQLDSNNKQWRLFADFFCDMANLTKLLAPVLPIPFIVTISVASVMNSLVGVAGGATKAAVSVHQAKNSNISDISAKESSQETIVNLAALLTSLTLLPLFTATTLTTWVTFILFMILHLYFNYKAMKSLRMETLNRPRLIYVLNNWVSRSKIPGIDEANLNEPLFTGAAFQTNYLGYGYSLKLGCSYHAALNDCCKYSSNEINQLHKSTLEYYKNEKFMLLTDDTNRCLYSIFKENISNQDQLLAFWTSYLYIINRSTTFGISSEFLFSSKSKLDVALSEASKLASQTFPKLLKEIETAGWILQPLQIGADEWKLQM